MDANMIVTKRRLPIICQDAASQRRPRRDGADQPLKALLVSPVPSSLSSIICSIVFAAVPSTSESDNAGNYFID
jgi:hypothetical protein